MKRFFCLVMASLVAFAASHRKDNYQLLIELKESAMAVVEQHQALINKNRDGTKAKKQVTKKIIADQTFKKYLTASNGQDWAIKKLKGSYDRRTLGVALALFLETARNVLAVFQDEINTDTDGTKNPKNFYPAVFGRLTAEIFLKKTGIKIKQTTTGKGRGARNSQYNSPDEWERQGLNMLAAKGASLANGFGEQAVVNGKRVYRYLFPLKIKKPCLACHGHPEGQYDITGHVKEGYKLGELRGAISVLFPDTSQ